MIKISSITKFLKDKNILFSFHGDENSIINTFSPLNTFIEKAIYFARDNSKIDVNFFSLNKNYLIVLNQFIPNISGNQIIVNDPHKIFFLILQNFFYKKDRHFINDKSVILSKSVGSNVNIGAFTFIDKEVTISKNVYISNNVTIKGKVFIGENTIIESGASIGVDGFGHFINSDHTATRVVHLGGVYIGHDVIIGSNTTISRGALSDTIIEDYVKIDNLCHIAHNVIVKKRSMITACVEISGSSLINEDVWIGPNSSIINGITIGKNCFVGIGTVVIKDIPENKVVAGVPARILKDNE
jgi:UDP-3-O-[3-hydroxymyristoyl] glucosamine N-acyltransferase